MKVLICEVEHKDFLKTRKQYVEYLKKKNVIVKCFYPITSNFKSYIFYFISVAKAIFSKYDVLHIFRAKNFVLLFPILLISIIRDKKNIIHITGLGRALINNKKTFYGYFLFYLLKFVKSHVTIIVQNSSDKDFLFNSCKINSILILGSGIKDVYDPASTHIKQKKSFFFPSRIEKGKGHLNFIQQVLDTNKYKDFNLYIAGKIKKGANSIPKNELNQIFNHPRVYYLGYLEDIYKYYYKFEYTVVFSNYREGIPRVAIESLMFNTPLYYNDFIGSLDLEKLGYIGININKKTDSKNSNNYRDLFLKHLESNIIHEKIYNSYFNI